MPGVLSAERFRALRPLWPQVADELAGWPGTVIVDLGRLHAGGPVMPLARASTAVLALTTATLGRSLQGSPNVPDSSAT